MNFGRKWGRFTLVVLAAHVVAFNLMPTRSWAQVGAATGGAKLGTSGVSVGGSTASTSAAQPAPAPAAPAAPAPVAAAASAPVAAPPPPPAAPAAAAPSSSPAADGYTVKLKGLERNVNELKEQVFRTKARLNQLKETILGGAIGASRGVIKFKNDMGGSFRLTKMVVALDGVQIFNKQDDSGRMAEMKDFDIYNGAIQPGSHTLSVQVSYRGHGFGVFSYLKGYNFKATGSHTFVAGEGKATVLTITGFEKGGVTTNMEDKPDLKFVVNIMNPEGTAVGAKK